MRWHRWTNYILWNCIRNILDMHKDILDDLYKFIGIMIVLMLVSCAGRQVIDMNYDDVYYINIGRIVMADTVGDEYYTLDVYGTSFFFKSEVDNKIVLISILPIVEKEYEPSLSTITK